MDEKEKTELMQYAELMQYFGQLEDELLLKLLKESRGNLAEAAYELLVAESKRRPPITDLKEYTNEIHDLGKYSNMQVCATCGELYGYVEHGEPRKLYYQKCKCAYKPDTPADEKKQQKWNWLDFNEALTLCACCGAEVIKSGKKYSYLLCDHCRYLAKDVKAIPIGRHPFVNGLFFPAAMLIVDAEKKHATGLLETLPDRIRQLDDWKRKVIMDNFYCSRKNDVAPLVDISIERYINKVCCWDKPKKQKKIDLFTKLAEKLRRTQ